MKDFCIVLGCVCATILLYRLIKNRPNKPSMRIRIAPIPRLRSLDLSKDIMPDLSDFDIWQGPNPSELTKEGIIHLAEEIIIGYPITEYEEKVLKLYEKNKVSNVFFIKLIDTEKELTNITFARRREELRIQRDLAEIQRDLAENQLDPSNKDTSIKITIQSRSALEKRILKSYSN